MPFKSAWRLGMKTVHYTESCNVQRPIMHPLTSLYLTVMHNLHLVLRSRVLYVCVEFEQNINKILQHKLLPWTYKCHNVTWFSPQDHYFWFVIECVDRGSLCHYWKDFCLDASYTSYLQINCRKSCNFCLASDATVRSSFLCLTTQVIFVIYTHVKLIWFILYKISEINWNQCCGNQEYMLL